MRVAVTAACTLGQGSLSPRLRKTRKWSENNAMLDLGRRAKSSTSTHQYMNTQDTLIREFTFSNQHCAVCMIHTRFTGYCTSRSFDINCFRNQKYNIIYSSLIQIVFGLKINKLGFTVQPMFSSFVHTKLVKFMFELVDKQNSALFLQK